MTLEEIKAKSAKSLERKIIAQKQTVASLADRLVTCPTDDFFTVREALTTAKDTLTLLEAKRG